MKKYLFLLGLIFVFFVKQGISQEVDTLNSHRPKIGLVLSGGGAKGFAHIGVLKVLEEQGIRPDYITGTSMGSIVAALYSLGYTPHQLEELVTSTNWDDLLSDKISLREISMFDKCHYPGYPLNIYFRHGKKPSLPSGMIEGQKIQALFSRLVWKSNQYQIFDSLPIPYRCVATDLISGQAIVFDKGDLALAMRSSMAIPTVFSPIDKDSMLLVDGGVVKNFPVQECIDMGADIIIGVYTGFESKPEKDELSSMMKVLTRTSVFQGVKESEEQALLTNVYIQPDLSHFGPENFDKGEDIIKQGELAARDSAALLALEKIAERTYPQAKRKSFIDSTKIWVDKIRVEGSHFSDSVTIVEMSELKEKSYISAEEVDEALNEIFSTWQFSKVSYYFDHDNLQTILVLKVKEKPRGIINVGLQYDNSYGPNLLMRASYTNLFIKSSQAVVKLALSANPRLQLNYKFYPTRRRRLEFSLNAYLQLNKMPDIIKEADITYSLGHYVYTHSDLNISLAWTPIRNVMLRASAGKQLNNIVLKEGMELYYDLKSVNYTLSYYQFGLHFNTLDNLYFPTKGLRVNTTFKSVFNANTNASDTSWLTNGLTDFNYIFNFHYEHYIRMGKRFSLIPEINMGLMMEEAFLTEKFFLGGFNYSLRPDVYNMGGVRANYIATDNFFIIGISSQFKFRSNIFFKMGIQNLQFANYADIDFEGDNNEEFNDNSLWSWNVGLGYRSKFGPLRLIISKSPEREEFVWSVNIGVPF